ncbi:MAG TPA: hypothetical protein VF142_06975 [Longimicrobium sp.]
MNATLNLATPPTLPAAPDGTAPHPPRWGAVFREQLRTVAAALRLERMVAGTLLVLVSLPLLFLHWQTPGHRTDGQFPEMMLVTGLLGLFAPMGVWKGEPPSRRAYLWALPVDRSRHTLVKVFAGWTWLMAAVGAYVLWAVAIAWATGGRLSMGTTHFLVRQMPPGVDPTAADLFIHPWPVPGWAWLVPFASATAAYLMGSIAVLASDHPWRWFAGVVLGWGLMAGIGLDWSAEATRALIEGRYGLEVLTTGGEAREVAVAVPGRGQVSTYTCVPLRDAWIGAALLWMGLGLAGTVAVALRRQER